MSLATKHRPKTTEEVIGNETAIGALVELLTKDDKDRPHTFLFNGPTGCGKTTLARIAASILKCHEQDLLEMNSASFRGIDTARQICKDVQFRSLYGAVRVWVLDECHQLTKDAQHGLLKVLEEPPEHVYFMLCTTSPDKLLPTIRNRAVDIQVRPLNEMEIMQLLKSTCKNEKMRIPKTIAKLIAQESLGHPRSALNMLERVATLPPEEMAAAVQQAAAMENEAIELCRVLMARNVSWSAVSKVIQGMKPDDDPESVRRLVIAYASSALLRSGDANAYFVLDAFSEPFFNTGKPGLVRAAYESLALRK